MFTIEQYLKSKVDFDLTDLTIRGILIDRDVMEGVDVRTLTDRQKELCLADAYLFVGTSSTASSGEMIADGGWQHTKSAKNVVNREYFLTLARSIYEKWGDAKSDTTELSRMKIKHLY